METPKPLIGGDKTKEILKKLGLKTSDLATLENINIRNAQIRAKNGMNGLSAACLLLLEKHPELLPEIWELSGYPEKAQESGKK